LEIPRFLANPALVFKKPGTILEFKRSDSYISALDRRSFIVGCGYLILLNNSWLWGMVILGPGVRVATVSLSHFDAKRAFIIKADKYPFFAQGLRPEQ
jgi:hypothetical protein